MKDRLLNSGSPPAETPLQVAERFREVKREATKTGAGIIFQDGKDIFVVFDPKRVGCQVEPL